MAGQALGERPTDQSDGIYRLIVEASPSALVLVEPKGTLELVNAKACELFGYSSSELVGLSVEVLIPRRFRLGHEAYIDSFMQDPQTRSMGEGRDLFGLRKDGTEFPIEIGLHALEVESGIHVLAAIIDLTDRKKSEARIRATVESAPTAMIMVERNGSIVLVNKETEQLFGYEREELLGRNVEALVPRRFSPQHPGLRNGFFNAPESRKMGAGRELFGLRKDGSEFPVEIGLNPIETDEGRFVLAAIIDVTERKHSEALERSNIELKRFAYVASHDLQSPLRSIIGFTQLLEGEIKGKVTPVCDDWLRRIIDNSHRMDALVNDLLAYARVDASPKRLDPVSLGSVCAEVLEMLHSAIESAEASVTVGDMPEVLGDTSQLIQLFQNLIGNAIKYRGPESPIVRISSATIGEHHVVSIRDNGIGIEPKHQERIFEVFRRLHAGPEYPGTGIGLAICRRVVQHHGGKIWVESDGRSWSTFSFSIPKLKETTH